jgi:hypothetical protein
VKRGDLIAVVAQPIAKVIDGIFYTDIQHCGGCHTMQENLNSGMSVPEALYERFYDEARRKRKEREQMKKGKQL